MRVPLNNTWKYLCDYTRRPFYILFDSTLRVSNVPESIRRAKIRNNIKVEADIWKYFIVYQCCSPRKKRVPIIYCRRPVSYTYTSA